MALNWNLFFHVMDVKKPKKDENISKNKNMNSEVIYSKSKLGSKHILRTSVTGPVCSSLLLHYLIFQVSPYIFKSNLVLNLKICCKIIMLSSMKCFFYYFVFLIFINFLHSLGMTIVDCQNVLEQFDFR